MQIFDAISDQIDAVGLPLYAISATRVNLPDTPTLLFLHWHGFRRATPLQLPGVSLPLRTVASTALQFDGPWPNGAEAEQEVLDAAWRLGAWSVERLERRACNFAGAPASEAYDCRVAFGDNAADFPDELVIGADRPFAELMSQAAQKGYSRWLFQPVKSSIWSDVGPGDDTLDTDGGRHSDCPIRPAPATGNTARQKRTLYQLGHLDRLLIP